MTIVGSFYLVCHPVVVWQKAFHDRNPDLMKDPQALISAIKKESIWLILGIAGLCIFVLPDA